MSTQFFKDSLILCLFLFSLKPITSIAENHSFTLGVINEKPKKAEYILNEYAFLVKYLREELAVFGIDVKPLKIAKNIPEMAKFIQLDQVDAILESVASTTLLKAQTDNLEPQLLAWRKQQRHYHSVFFVRNDSGLRHLNDLKGKRIAFESARSTSAFIVPKVTLQTQTDIPLIPYKEGEKNADSLSYQFANSEINQAYWVHQKKVDVGAFNDGDWARLPHKIKQDMHLIYQTKPIIRWLFSVVESSPKSVQNKVMNVLVNAHQFKEGKQALAQAANTSKFEVLTEKDRDDLLYWEQMILEQDD